MDLARWVDAILKHGAGRTDAALFAAAYRAVEDSDEATLGWVAERADVLRGSSELALESTAQGTAFLSTVGNTWPPENLGCWTDVLAASGRPPAHAVAVAVVTACAGMPLEMALTGYLHVSPPISYRRGCSLFPSARPIGSAR